MCGWHSNSFTEARSWPTLLPRRRPSLFTHRLICLTAHRDNVKFNVTYVWSKCELFVWSRCRGMGKALLLWCMQEIGGDCLRPASRIHKGNEPAMMRTKDWDCIIGAQSKSQSGESPRCVRYSLNVVRLFIISDRERNKPPAGLTDKFSLSRSQSTELPSTINYAVIQMWLCCKWNRMYAKSVLISKYSSLFSHLLSLLLPPIFLLHFLLLSSFIFCSATNDLCFCVSINIFSRLNVLKFITVRLHHTERQKYLL